MIRKILDYSLTLTEQGKPLARLRPLFSAVDAFSYEVPFRTSARPFIRDAVDLKRWMVLVIFALLPPIFMAIWNTGVQKFVYSSGNSEVMSEYLLASASFSGYINFVSEKNHFWNILIYGLEAFLPVMLISYLVGGIFEAIFACVRRHEIAEGFLVTGMLYPLILPPTIPYWMVALGVAVGVVLSKELFGGTGMNILNPALTCRCFLFFTFPGKMTGDVWAGTNPSKVALSINQMNLQAGLNEVDGYTQATALGNMNAAIVEIKRIHVDTIAAHKGVHVPTLPIIEEKLSTWSHGSNFTQAGLESLSDDQIRTFITAPLEQGGLGLLPGNYPAASHFVETAYGIERYSDGNLFWGNILGSFGETSTFACLLGAAILIITGIGAWRTIVSAGIAAFLTAFLFQFFSTHFGIDSGAWNPAKYAMPAYRHLLMGGLAFGLVYMATDPVSSPSLNLSKWIYGALIGFVTILIRLINPAYPEGVMLAILFGNVFAPLFDHFSIRQYRRRPRGKNQYA